MFQVNDHEWISNDGEWTVFTDGPTRIYHLEEFVCNWDGIMTNVPTKNHSILPDEVISWLESLQQSPQLVGLSEAAEILGWQKQQVSVYINRGKFPQPIQRLASGPIWTRQQILDYQGSL